jgi:hypothetical protein
MENNSTQKEQTAFSILRKTTSGKDEYTQINTDEHKTTLKMLSICIPIMAKIKPL